MVERPAQILTEVGLKVRSGGGITVTVASAVAIQLPLPVITVYTVVAAGEADTELPVTELSPVEGVQV